MFPLKEFGKNSRLLSLMTLFWVFQALILIVLFEGQIDKNKGLPSLEIFPRLLDELLLSTFQSLDMVAVRVCFLYSPKNDIDGRYLYQYPQR